MYLELVQDGADGQGNEQQDDGTVISVLFPVELSFECEGILLMRDVQFGLD